MSAFDKTAQGTAVLEASDNARAEAPDGKARRAVGEIPALRPTRVPPATARAAPSGAAGPSGGAYGRRSGPAPWAVLLGAGQLKAARAGVPETPDEPARATADSDTNKKQKKHKAPDLWYRYEIERAMARQHI